MSVVRTHHYSVDSADVDELIARRGTLIAAIRAGHPGLTRTELFRLDDGTYADTWHWDSAEQMGAAFAAIREFPDAPLAMALTRDSSAQNGTVLDER